MSSHNHYDILGVPLDASEADIRKAYLLRTKMFHPDRFNRASQEKEWNLANEMLKELNQAYSVLKDSRTRSVYTDGVRPKTKPQTSPPPTREPPPTRPSRHDVKLGRLKAGFARFKSLPNQTQKRLIERIQKKNQQQFIVSLDGVFWRYIFALVSVGWFFLLFYLASDSYWTSENSSWYAGLSLFFGAIGGLNISWIYRYHACPLKCALIVTPLYFIKTHFNSVWFWPLWDLKDMRATHNYRNGAFTGTTVNLIFLNGSECLTFPQQSAYDLMVSALRTFDGKVRTAKQQQDGQYFYDEDDFRAYDPQSADKPYRRPSVTTVICCLSAILVSVVTFSIFAAYNSQENPYTPPKYVELITPRSTPKPIILPAKVFNEPVQLIPQSGEIRRYTTTGAVAPLQIKSSSGSNYLVKLDDARTGRPVLSLFVRGGEVEEINVPVGTYIVKYASGTTWYGYHYLFGPDTHYNKAEKPFSFTSDGYQYSGYTITLYAVRNGNLHTSPIDANEF